jgi:hypothetical protein
MYRKYSSLNPTSSCDVITEPALGPTSVFKSRVGKQFSLNRPAYRSATTTTIDKMGRVIYLTSERSG